MLLQHVPISAAIVKLQVTNGTAHGAEQGITNAWYSRMCYVSYIKYHPTMHSALLLWSGGNKYLLQSGLSIYLH